MLEPLLLEKGHHLERTMSAIREIEERQKLLDQYRDLVHAILEGRPVTWFGTKGKLVFVPDESVQS